MGHVVSTQRVNDPFYPGSFGEAHGASAGAKYAVSPPVSDHYCHYRLASLAQPDFVLSPVQSYTLWVHSCYVRWASSKVPAQGS